MSANPKSRSKIEIISASGKHVGTAPVLVTQADGTQVAGMRWAEAIGWTDPQHVFAEGSANPYAGEYRTIDVLSGKMGGYIGAGFATCASKGWVAYWTPVFPTHRSMQVEVNGRDVGFGFPDAIDGIPDIHVPLQWTPDCQYFAFLDSPAARHACPSSRQQSGAQGGAAGRSDLSSRWAHPRRQGSVAGRVEEDSDLRLPEEHAFGSTAGNREAGQTPARGPRGHGAETWRDRPGLVPPGAKPPVGK